MSTDDEASPDTPAAETLSPAQHAARAFVKNDRGHWPFDYWKHLVAERRHGWARHAHHAGEPMQLSAAVYAAAIKAVEDGSEVCLEALSEFKPAPIPLPPDEEDEFEDPDSDETVTAVPLGKQDVLREET